jgi:hypothetical protein
MRNKRSTLPGSGSGANWSTSSGSVDGGLASQSFVDDGSVFDVVYNAGGAGNDGVQYLGTASVPEPGTWGMLLGGITMLIALRRRKRA